EHDIRAVPGVATLAQERVTPAVVNGSSAPVIGLDTQAIDSVYDLGVSAGSIRAVQGNAVALAPTQASSAPIHVGDTVRMHFADGQPLSMPVAAIFNGNSVGGDADWVVGIDTFTTHVADQFDRRLFLKLQPGVAPATARPVLLKALASWPNASLEDGTQ